MSETVEIAKEETMIICTVEKGRGKSKTKNVTKLTPQEAFEKVFCKKK